MEGVIKKRKNIFLNFTIYCMELILNGNSEPVAQPPMKTVLYYK